MNKKRKKKIVLIDMDGTMADFTKSVLKQAEIKGYGKVKNDSLKSFRITNYFTNNEDSIKKIIFEKGFYKNLEPINGAIESINEMLTS